MTQTLWAAWTAWAEAIGRGDAAMVRDQGLRLAAAAARAGQGAIAQRIQAVLDQLDPPRIPPTPTVSVRPPGSWRWTPVPRLYIAGPMTGYPDYNYPAFFAAATALTAVGYAVVNPAETGVQDEWTWSDYLRVGLQRLCREATGVALLPGWRHSRGARLEAVVAHRLGLPVHRLATWLATDPQALRRHDVLGREAE